jgi:hypothetical protein
MAYHCYCKRLSGIKLRDCRCAFCNTPVLFGDGAIRFNKRLRFLWLNFDKKLNDMDRYLIAKELNAEI